MYVRWKILVTEDFGKATFNIRTELWGEVKWLREEGYFAVIKQTNGMKWRRNKCVQLKPYIKT